MTIRFGSTRGIVPLPFRSRDGRVLTCLYDRGVAKVAVQHVCSECGYSTPRWLGRCPGCSEWGTLVEEVVDQGRNGSSAAVVAAPLVSLAEIEAAEAKRVPTGVLELDRVLGGGLVPASLVLVSGDP